MGIRFRYGEHERISFKESGGSEKMRERVFKLSLLGYSVEEISDILGISEVEVRDIIDYMKQTESCIAEVPQIELYNNGFKVRCKKSQIKFVMGVLRGE